MQKHIWLSSLILFFALGMGWSSQAQVEPTLRELGQERGLRMGAGVSHFRLFNTPAYVDLLTTHYDIMTPTTELKMQALRPSPGVFDFSRSDEMIAFAQENDLDVVGHTLVWYLSMPDWLENRVLSREEAIAILEEHITTTVSRYRGEIYAWDVVNEAVSPDGTLSQNIWYESIGPEYIAMAFEWAHAADPDALLIYNDYDMEINPDKAQGVLALLRSMLAADVPIDGVGFQMHLTTWEELDLEALQALMEEIGDMGLQVKITEMDVRIGEHEGTREEALEVQAQLYRDVMTICLAVEACTSFTTWGFSDAHSWLNESGLEDPLPFDENYNPKPAFFALQSALMGVE